MVAPTESAERSTSAIESNPTGMTHLAPADRPTEALCGARTRERSERGELDCIVCAELAADLRAN